LQNQLEKAKYFISLNLKDIYYQVRIKKDEK